MASIGRLHTMARARLGHAPTPLEAMPNLSRNLRSGRFYVKRDDCTGLAFGGNKVRQLEFYVGEALRQGADTLLITGATQSNFVRLTAAAAAQLGMACHIQLERRVPRDDPGYKTSGNVLLDQLFGAHLTSYDDGEDETGADTQMEKLADQLRGAGKRPYMIYLSPGHTPLGALGYVVAAQELIEQIERGAEPVDEIFVGSGSGHTHAGLLFGLRALGCDIRVNGICVRREKDQQQQRIAQRCLEIAELLETDSAVKADDILLDDCVLAPGYGRLNPKTHEAIQLAARQEGLLLDPVYTGKVFAGMLEQVRTRDTQSALFWHTGGTPALFAYEADLTASMGAELRSR